MLDSVDNMACWQSAAPSGDAYNGKPLGCAIDMDTSSVPPTGQPDLFRSWYAEAANPELSRKKKVVV
jgi:hypothetical protein